MMRIIQKSGHFSCFGLDRRAGMVADLPAFSGANPDGSEAPLASDFLPKKPQVAADENPAVFSLSFWGFIQSL